jgi:hypothetical protein
MEITPRWMIQIIQIKMLDEETCRAEIVLDSRVPIDFKLTTNSIMQNFSAPLSSNISNIKLKSSELTEAKFLTVLAVIRSEGWALITSNSFTDNKSKQTIKCFYFEAPDSVMISSPSSVTGLIFDIVFYFTLFYGILTLIFDTYY